MTSAADLRGTHSCSRRVQRPCSTRRGPRTDRSPARTAPTGRSAPCTRIPLPLCCPGGGGKSPVRHALSGRRCRSGAVRRRRSLVKSASRSRTTVRSDVRRYRWSDLQPQRRTLGPGGAFERRRNRLPWPRRGRWGRWPCRPPVRRTRVELRSERSRTALTAVAGYIGAATSSVDCTAHGYHAAE
jgi:hypothetical protein